MNGMKIIIVSSLPNSGNVSIYSVTLAIILTSHGSQKLNLLNYPKVRVVLKIKFVFTYSSA